MRKWCYIDSEAWLRKHFNRIWSSNNFISTPTPDPILYIAEYIICHHICLFIYQSVNLKLSSNVFFSFTEVGRDSIIFFHVVKNFCVSFSLFGVVSIQSIRERKSHSYGSRFCPTMKNAFMCGCWLEDKYSLLLYYYSCLENVIF